MEFKLKLKIRYSTKEKKRTSENSFRYVQKDADLFPVLIIRIPCGSGQAANRFYYRAQIKAPIDASFTHDGFITENINRKTNPQFNPKNFIFENNVAKI